MASQEPKPPWGRRNRPRGPEEILAQLLKKIDDFFNNDGGQRPPSAEPGKTPGGGHGGVGKVAALMLALLIALTIYGAFYKINPGEVGVVLRLGKFYNKTQPGLHVKIPYVDAVTKVDVERTRRLEFGFRDSDSRAAILSGDQQSLEMESLSLTADKNVINVEWIVQYKVSDPYNFLYKIKNVEQAIHDASESVTRRVIGNMDFDYVLSNRELLAGDVKRELQELLNTLEAGVSLVTVQFRNINPPDPVKPAFNEVNEADQDMKRLVNEAEATYNKVIPKARGDAKKNIEESYGYAATRVNGAKGETERYLAILKEYKNAPEVTRRRMYLETMQAVLPSVKNVYVMTKGHNAPLPFINLSEKGLTQGLAPKNDDQP
ncbi:MAG: FtsH protease activity modulator HflK [Desulfobulbaceae bacterium]|jgi:membrane protease subunit HflK|nr:FtsH protease activity modulator HflK [Desulfobulbaceae bacterium]